MACRQAEEARRAGNLERAAAAWRQALASAPDHAPAQLGMARLALDQGRWQAAETAYRAYLKRHPGDAVARYGLGTARLEQGAAEEAEALFDALVRGGDRRPQIRFMRGRARLQCLRVADALEDLRQAFAADGSPLSLQALAGTLWMAGEESEYERVLREAAARPTLLAAAAELRRQQGDPRAAIALVADAAKRGALSVPAVAVVATAHVDLHEPVAAERAAWRCLQHTPGHEVAMAAILSAFLMQGRPRDALQAVAPLRRAQPDRQHWIAYELTALRLMGDARCRQLIDYARHVRAFELPAPAGYADLAAFNRALLEALQRWHVFERQPLGQTLRGGIQTPRDLRGLPEPAVQAFFAALDGPISEYLRAIGTSPDCPLTARNGNGYAFAGAWSVQLFGGGHHVDHVHPSGWISSAYYVRVPNDEAPRTTGEAVHADTPGAIRFGRPPFPCGELDAETSVRPRAGQLVLFPSYLWHGTSPTVPGSVRVTAPFDLVPGGER